MALERKLEIPIETLQISLPPADTEEKKDQPAPAAVSESEYEDVHDIDGFYIGERRKNDPDGEVEEPLLVAKLDVTKFTKEELSRPGRQLSYFWRSLEEGNLKTLRF